MAKGKKRKIHATNGKHETATKPQGKAAASPATKVREPTIPFHAEDRILLVGEGDFSYAKAIVEHHGCYEIVATCFDSQDVLYTKYDPQAKEHISYLEEEGQTVLYNVDATKLDRNKAVKDGTKFDVVLFNFPHVGGKSKDVNRQVRFNQELLVKFFTSAAPLLADDGTVVVTLFEGEPYTLWNVKDLARHAGLEVERSFKFVAEAYPGYSHARTLGNIEGGGGWKGEDREARSFVFRKKAVEIGKDGRHLSRGGGGGGKRKRGGEEDSSDDEG
ncbi:hypothetical protein LTR62_005592 [Meristemomyces frigidus]|uniref:25S rRNA (uridine-N(3))-methyltransferase BMT5-like domain-containing protein n=1 Tax=Meristemomyces frigidus TaxID=1508187 RepID=A0AAN7TDB6_9PEZI|nr:hypothetical protein LTR62_005592 [Meristemomyces frigidus]